MAENTGSNSPTDISRYLSGVDFPADKSSLVKHARDNGADEEVVKFSTRCPNRNMEVWPT